MESRNLRHIFTVSVSTMGSRVLGLIRDILLFAALGTSLFNSAFILAFTIPNLFRRLLGEGALTSAVIPILSDRLHREDRAAGFWFINQVLSRLTFVLVLLTGVGVLLAFCIRYLPYLEPRAYLVGELSLLMLPYMIFICLSAIFCAALQVFGKFSIPALSPILLNLSMIAFLLLPVPMSTGDPALRTLYLSIGVLLGGFLQLVVPGLALWRQGWRPRWDFAGNRQLEELWRLLLPGLAGAAVLQVNILVSRGLAYTLSESAVAELYLASRLMELPLGVFTIAIVTVFFPTMSRQAAAGAREDMAGSLREGLHLTLAITIPAGMGLIVFGHAILEVLFNYGAFSSGDVSRVGLLLAVYGVGLPFYSLATLSVRGLHAMKDMKTPVRIAVVALLVNVVGSVALMIPFGAAGLAVANIVAATVQAFWLLRTIRRSNPFLNWKNSIGALGKILVASSVMGAFCLGALAGVDALDLGTRTAGLVLVSVGIPLAVLCYFSILGLLRFEGLERLVEFMKARLDGKVSP